MVLVRSARYSHNWFCQKYKVGKVYTTPYMRDNYYLSFPIVTVVKYILSCISPETPNACELCKSNWKLQLKSFQCDKCNGWLIYIFLTFSSTVVDCSLFVNFFLDFLLTFGVYATYPTPIIKR